MANEVLSVASREGFISLKNEGADPVLLTRQVGGYHATLSTLSQNASKAEEIVKGAIRGFLALTLAPLEASLQARDSIKKVKYYHAKAVITEGTGHDQQSKIWQVMRNERVFAAVTQVIFALSFTFLAAVGLGAMAHLPHKLLMEGAVMGASLALTGALIYGLGQAYKQSHRKELDELALFLKSPQLDTLVFPY